MNRAYTLAFWSFVAILVIFVLEVVIRLLGTGALVLAMYLSIPVIIVSFLIPIALVWSLILLARTPRDASTEIMRKKTLRYNLFGVVVYVTPIIFVFLRTTTGISFFPISAYFEPFSLLSLLRIFFI